MKIKILKDIPGYKAGEIADISNCEYLGQEKNDRGFSPYTYAVVKIINEGFAEEIKDDIDIEAIREYAGSCMCGDVGSSWHEPRMQNDEYEWLKAYRIVKAVIEKINVEKCIPKHYEVGLEKATNEFSVRNTSRKNLRLSFLPKASRPAIEKIIELCEPELKVLFGLKNA